jgi:hypothetical protein
MNSIFHQSTDFEKQKHMLEKDSLAFKEAFSEELAKLSGMARKTGTTAVIIGGGLFLSYYLIKKIFFRKPSKKYKAVSKTPSSGIIVQKPRKDSVIVAMIKEQIALFLITIAKEKLRAFLKASEKTQ